MSIVIAMFRKKGEWVQSTGLDLSFGWGVWGTFTEKVDFSRDMRVS